jgi:hypothetical protein
MPPSKEQDPEGENQGKGSTDDHEAEGQREVVTGADAVQREEGNGHEAELAVEERQRTLRITMTFAKWCAST